MYGLANPASQYCIQQGGTLQIVKNKDGNETGLCHLPDGTVIEEWQLLRSHQDNGQVVEPEGEQGQSTKADAQEEQ